MLRFAITKLFIKNNIVETKEIDDLKNYHDINKKLQQFRGITDRLCYEKNKITHIWLTLDLLRDLICNEIPNHPKIHIIKF